MSPEKKPEQPKEQEAVFTTIVGGRPPGSGTRVGAIPRGVEVLLKKASVDPEFCQLLLEKRAEAARTIDLELTNAEREMLAQIPAEQLEQIIRNTKVKPEQRSIFQGTAGKLMIAAVIGVGIVSVLTPSLGHTAQTAGISPEEIRRIEKALADANDPNDPNAARSNLPPGQRPSGEESLPRTIIETGIRPN